MPQRPDRRHARSRRIALFAAAAIALLAVAIAQLAPHERGAYVPYATFVEQMEAGAIEQASIARDGISFTLHGSDALYATDNPDAPDLCERLLLNGAKVSRSTNAEDMLLGLFDLLLYGIVLGAVGFAVYKAVGLNRSTFRVVRRTGVRFSDIAGMEQPKHELTRLVDVLKNPARYAGKGIRPVKGVILEGPPGNGKTLFARALATEADINFIATKGADFQGALMSMGSAKIRMLFRKAARHAPCIVFIDEFDSIGERRNYAGTGIDKENNRIITAMLNEMDGFESSGGILVVAATNSYRSLDPALVRPGRFDMKFAIGNPDRPTRAELVELYTRRAGRPLAQGLTTATLVDAFDGLSCAAIETVLNGAATETLADGANSLTVGHIKSAAEKTGVSLKAGAFPTGDA